jgi:RNA polymerase sigma factor (sigma-70 family)
MKHEIRIYLPATVIEGEYTCDMMYREYQKPLFKIFSMLLKEKKSEAEDLVHEVFLRVVKFDRRCGLINLNSIASFLSTIARSVYVDYKRSHGEKDMRNYDDDPDALISLVIASDKIEMKDPRDILSDRQDLYILMEKIVTLNQIDRNLIRCIYCEGMNLKATAIELGVKYEMIKKRIQRLRLAMMDTKETILGTD